MNSTPPLGGFSRSEILQVVLKVSIFSLATIFTVKWMMKQLDPTNKQKKNAARKAQVILNQLGVKNVNEFSEYEMMIASHLVDPKDIPVSWSNIGGLKNVIDDIKETVILPIKRRDLFADSQLTHAPKGVLLHGPPGCGKTMLAKATAKEAGTRFINLDISILTDKWYGESQKLAAAVFSLAVKLQPCIIFIDEIDSFLRDRKMHDHEATAMMKAQFMTLWDGLITDSSCTVIVMGATNRPHDLDKAIVRRMPAQFHIALPNLAQRHDILKLIMKSEPLAEDINLKRIADCTEGFSGSDLKELCRNASMYRVRDYMKINKNSLEAEEVSSSSSAEQKVKQEVGRSRREGEGEEEEEYHDTLRPITMEDMRKSLRNMREAKVQCASISGSLGEPSRD